MFYNIKSIINTYIYTSQDRKEIKYIISKLDNTKFLALLYLYDGSIINITIKNNGYIEASELCKFRKKNIDDWLMLTETQSLIKALGKILKLKTSKIVIKKQKDSKYIWIHPDLAFQFSLWASTYLLALTVSKIIKKVILISEIQNVKIFK
jgi:hypothetical protein